MAYEVPVIREQGNRKFNTFSVMDPYFELGVRFAAIGDIHGDFALAATHLRAMVDKLGPVKFVLAVGDAEPNRDQSDADGVVGPKKYRKLGDFPHVVAGDIDFGVPLFFIGGNHDPYPALDANGPGRWAGDTWWLGRAGVIEIWGLRVGYLSGIHSEKYSHLPEPSRVGKRDRTYWHESELAAIDGLLDVLVTHDWPSGIGTTKRGDPAGHPAIRGIIERCQPAVVVCGHHHHRLEANIGDSRVVCLPTPQSGRSSVEVFEVVGENPTAWPKRRLDGGSMRNSLAPSVLLGVRCVEPKQLASCTTSRYCNLVSWEVEFTDEFEQWWDILTGDEQDRIAAGVRLLATHGPSLGRPTVDTISGSRHANMKELRAGTTRTLFAFDPRRTAILLLGGDKSGQWNRWYETAIPQADDLYDEHLESIDDKDAPHG